MKIKMNIILPLVILGFYCPPTEENEFPTVYQLQSCRFYFPYQRVLASSSSYRIECREEDPLHCQLLERGPLSQIITYRFDRATVKFFSMKDREQALVIRSKGLEYGITCNFMSLTSAQQFYRLITRDRPSTLAPILTADHLEKSDGTIVAEPATIYLEDEEMNRRVTILTREGDPVLIFPETAVTQKMQHEDSPSEILMDIAINGAEAERYKFMFQTFSQAGYLMASVGQ